MPAAGHRILQATKAISHAQSRNLVRRPLTRPLTQVQAGSPTSALAASVHRQTRCTRFSTQTVENRNQSKNRVPRQTRAVRQNRSINHWTRVEDRCRRRGQRVTSGVQPSRLTNPSSRGRSRKSVRDRTREHQMSRWTDLWSPTSNRDLLRRQNRQRNRMYDHN